MNPFLDNSSRTATTVIKNSVWRAERSQHCLISELLLFESVQFDLTVVPQLSGGFNSWHVSNDFPKFSFKFRLRFLCRPTWNWLSSIVPPEIITMKSQWKSVVSNTLKNKVLNDKSSFKNASRIFFLLRSMVTLIFTSTRIKEKAI